MNNQGDQRGTPPQNPGHQQYAIPKERFDELNNRYKSVEQQNQELRRQVDFLYQQQMQLQQRGQQPQIQEDDSPFEPNTVKAMRNLFQKELKQTVEPMAQNFRNQLGGLAEENDKLHFMLKYGPDQYGKYQEKIERLRQEKAGQGNWLSREEAFKFVHYDETSRKPKENPVQPLGASIDPYTGEIVQPQVQTQAPPQQQPQYQNQLTPPQFQQAQAPAPQEPWDEPALPPAGIVEGGYAPPSNAGTQKLSINSSEKDLQAWEQQFGNKQF